MVIRDSMNGDIRGLRWLLVVVLSLSILGGAFDLWLDAPEDWHSFHAVYELLLIATAVVTSLVLWRGWFQERVSLRKTRKQMTEQIAEQEAWRESARHALEGLASAVNQRFSAWDLTPTEREVALALLKGSSHKAIAYATGRSERTIRQHAVAIYQKSGLAGRAELSAFFLEGLQLPGGLPPR